MSITEVTDFTINGKCSQCGQCCSNLLPLSDKEIARIKAYVKKHGIKEQRHNALMAVDMTCPFRDERNKKCLIYEIRPEICRVFQCNQERDVIVANKMRMHGVNNVVLMRNEFFGSTEDLDFVIREVLGVRK